MPQVDVDGLTINYDVQGDGEPLLLIPYLSADHAGYAFQLPAYAEHFSCIALDLPGRGERQALRAVLDRIYADQVAGFLGAIGLSRHISQASRWRRSRHSPRGPPSGSRALALDAQRVGHHRSVFEDDPGALADGGSHATERRGHRDSGDFPALLYARDVRRPTGVRRYAGGLRPWPTGSAAGGVPRPDRGGHEP